MKRLSFILMAAASLLFVNCVNHDDDLDVNIPLDKDAISANAKNLFDEIDSDQNWSSITKGSVVVTADADLDDIVKVQILTESPFGNKNAAVLNEATVNKGQKVKLVYDAPNVYDTLFAACVSKDNSYYVKVFSVKDSEVSFTDAAASRLNRAGEVTANQFPDASAIVLGQPKKSFNALRAEATQQNGYFIASEKNDGSGNKWKYDQWNDSWLNDYLWAPVDAADNNGWTIKDGNIYRENPNKEDLTTIQWLVRYYLPKQTNGTKNNNWKSIVEGTNYFKEYKNHFVSNGEPLTIVPLQMNSNEGHYNAIYYYYFKPEDLANKTTDEELAEFIKTLPKFKAINGYKGDNGAYHNDKEYLLPYYGDNAIATGNTAIQSLSIPEGYLIGFMNQKTKEEERIDLPINGCTYGFGPLNIENNHLIGHYFSAISKNVSQQATKVWYDKGVEKTSTSTSYGLTSDGMTWDSPRIGIFNANKKVFMCFEDGSDCNFSDMIVEINSGVEVYNEPIKPQAASYVMCFEDEPETADYDMNDVVLRGIRLNDEQIEITLIACGADDELDIKGLQNTQRLGKKEVHKFFGVTPGEGFINTQKDQKYYAPVSEVFTIDKNISVEDFLKTVSVYNRKTGKTISIPKNGEPPYAIVVPLNFRYPVERCNIITAYPDFKKWAQNRNEATDWYLNGIENNLYPDMFSTAE